MCLASAWIASQMLWAGTFFRLFYRMQLPWAHGVLGISTLAVACAGLVWLALKSRWLAFTRQHLLKVSVAMAVVLFVGLVLHRFRPLPKVEGANRPAVAYLERALRYLERYYLRRDEVDWPTVRRKAFDRARGARSPEDTFPAIVAALDAIGDPHNTLLASNWRRRHNRRAIGTTSIPGIRAHLTEDGVAYVAIPSFVGSGGGSLYVLTDNKGRAYAETLRQTLRELDEQQPRGWILDLRQNTGGNMWPMLDGLAPLIGEGCVAAMDMPQFDRRIETWIVNGRATSGPPWFAGLTPWKDSARLRQADAPVVVLTGPHTASSGEAVAVALRGRNRTRFIGSQTAGVPTALQGVSLGSGAELMITIGRLADRTGRAYDGPIVPDELLATVSTSELVAAATAWICAQGS